jgi:acetyltransferase-like isoleucine patch superfamily enzyme
MKNIILLCRDVIKTAYLLCNQVKARLIYIERKYPSSIAISARLDIYKNKRKPYKLSIGKYSLIERFCVINSWIGDVTIKDNAIIGINSIVIGPVLIEDNVQISQNCFICGENRAKDPNSGHLLSDSFDVRPVTIEKNVWIGSNSSILPGVKIGENSIIGAGSVVTKDIPKNVIAAGIPATPIKAI